MSKRRPPLALLDSGRGLQIL